MAITSSQKWVQTSNNKWKYIYTGSTGVAIRSSAAYGATKLGSFYPNGHPYHDAIVEEIEQSSGWLHHNGVSSWSIPAGWSLLNEGTHFELYSSGSGYYETVYSGSAKINYYWPNSTNTGYTLWVTDTITYPSFTYRSAKSSYSVSSSSNFYINAYSDGAVYKTVTCTKTTTQGFNFSGWSTTKPTAAGYYESYNTGSGWTTSDINLYPVFTYGNSSTSYSNNTLSSISNPTKNSTTFNIPVELMNEGSLYTTLNATGTTSFTFSKWVLSNGNNAPSSFTESTNIYAQWTEQNSVTSGVSLPTLNNEDKNNAYTLSFDSNGGDSISSRTAGKVTKTFNGWFTASSGGTNCNGSYTPTSTSKSTLYAQWTMTITNNVISDLPTPTRSNIDGNTYTITFDANTGAISGNSSATAIRGKHEYTFLGWYNGSTKVTSVTLTGNLELTASWRDDATNQTITLSGANKSPVSADLYTTTLDPNSGSVSQTTFRSGQKEYTFKGWYTAKTGGTRIGGANETYAPTFTGTVYAQWTESSAASLITLPTPTRQAINGTKSTITLNEGYDTGTASKTIDVYLGNRTYKFTGWYNESGEKVNTNYYPTASGTLTAHWDEYIADGSTSISNPNARPSDEGIYTINLDPNGGSVTITSKSCGIRIYTFTGWYTESGSKVNQTNYTPPSGGITLYASWSESISTESIGSLPTPSPGNTDGETYIISFKGNGGTPNKSNITAIRGLRKYSFDGWYTDKNSGSKITSTYTPSNNMTAYAHWTLIESQDDVVTLPSASRDTDTDIYTVTFNPNGGDVSVASKTAGAREWDFDAWYTTANDDGDRIGGYNSSYIPSGSGRTIELFAHWIPNIVLTQISLPTPSKEGSDGETYTVTFRGNGGIADFTSKQLVEGRIVHTFTGWYTDPEYGEYIGKGNYTPERTIELFAHYSTTETNESVRLPSASKTMDEGIYTVTFNPNGGSVNTKSKTACNRLYNLMGWYTAETGGKLIGGEYDEYTPVNNIILYAHWSEEISYTSITSFETPTRDNEAGNKYTITFDGNGGSAGASSLSAIRGKVDYTFLGWYDPISDYPISTPYTPTGNIELKAKWDEVATDQTITLPTATIKNYDGYDVTINFNSAGGDPVNPVTLYINKIAYDFDGWYTDASLGRKVGNIGDIYTPNSSITLFAHWNESYSSDSLKSAPNCNKTGTDKYVVTLDSAAESVILQQTKLNAIRHLQYEFLGWFTEATGGNELSLPFTPGATSHSMTVYAHWGEATQTSVDPVDLPQSVTRQDITSHTLHYDPDGGIIVGSGSSATAIIEKTTDFSFLGWYTAKDTGGSKVSFSYTPRDNITLFARYVKSNESASSVTHPSNLYKNSTSGECTITLDSGDASVSLKSSTIKSPKTIDYTFNGWYVDGVLLESVYIPYAEDVYAIAKWDEAVTIDPVTLETLSSYNTDGHFTVTFDPTSSGSINIENNIIKIGKLRHIFDGWFTNTGESVPYKYTPTDDISLIGHWNTSVIKEALQLPIPTPNNKSGEKRTVYFNGNTGNAEIPSKEAIVGKIDYNFLGWLTPSNINIGSDTYTPESDIKLTAKWETVEYDNTITLPNATKDGEPGTYTVIFNPNGGVVDTPSKQAGRTEFRLSGWFTEISDGESAGTPGSKYVPKMNGETLYARWSPYVESSSISLPKASNISKDDDPGTQVLITLDTRGGTITSDTEIMATIDGTHYKFEYWKNPSGERVPDPYTPSGNIELMAVWSETKFNDTIKLDIPTKNVPTEYEITLANIEGISTPIEENPIYASKYDNYSFLGWYNDTNTKIEDYNNFIPTKSETLHAEWKYTDSSNNPASLPTLSKLGYDFVGWAIRIDNPEDIYTTTYMPTENTTLYAIWSAKGLIYIGKKSAIAMVYIDGAWYRLVPEVAHDGKFNICV